MNNSRKNTVQAVANDASHPAQALYHNEQSCKLYWWLNFWLHMPDELHLPKAEDFTLHAQVQKQNLQYLKDNFTIVLPEAPRCLMKNEDLLMASQPQIVAFHSECVSSIPNYWTRRLENEWGYSSISVIDNTNPLRAPESETPQPGTITTEYSNISGRWIAKMYTQFETGAATKSETQARRLKWFEKCLKQLTTFMVLNDLICIGFPLYVGCVNPIMKEWLPYAKAIETWRKENPYLNVIIYST